MKKHEIEQGIVQEAIDKLNEQLKFTEGGDSHVVGMENALEILGGLLAESKPSFEVEISRWGKWDSTQYFTVKADSKEEALDKAKDMFDVPENCECDDGDERVIEL